MCSGWRRRGCGCAGPGPPTPRRSIAFAAYGRSPAIPPASPTPIRRARPSVSSIAAREGNASGRDLTLVMTPIKGKRDAIGSISLESRGGDRLTLGFVLAPEHWGKGLATEATEAIVKAGFELDRRRSKSWPTSGRERRLAPCPRDLRLRDRRRTGLKGAPARGGLVECHTFRLTREAWADWAAPRRRRSIARLDQAHAGA